MSTEEFALALATPSLNGLVASERTIPFRGSTTVQTFKDLMVEGGWIFDEGGSPRAWVKITVHIDQLPVMTIPPNDVLLPGSQVCDQEPAIRVITVDGIETAAWAWDAGKYDFPPCDVFAMGGSQEETYLNYLSKLLDLSGLHVIEEAYISTFIVDLALEGTRGPAMNGIRIAGWAAGTLWNGGWALWSQTYRGHTLHIKESEGPGRLYDNYYTWDFHIRLDGPENPSYLFSLGLSPKDTKFSPYSGPSGVPAGNRNETENESWFRLCVCPYQFGLWFDGGNDTGPGPGPRSLFVSMPWVPDGYLGHTAFVFVANSSIGAFRGSLMWTGRTQFDLGAWSTDDFERMIIPVMRTRIHQVYAGSTGRPEILTNTQGALLMENAYVSARKVDDLYLANNRICGKLWNCAVVHNHYPVSTISTSMQGKTWFHVSSQDYREDYSSLAYNVIAHGAQAASVWWRMDAGG